MKAKWLCEDSEMGGDVLRLLPETDEEDGVLDLIRNHPEIIMDWRRRARVRA